MSRGFVKEEDQEEAPLIPPRAALPAGIDNYVTDEGYAELQEEKKSLEAQRHNNPEENETERRRLNMLIDGKLRLLDERLSSAKLIPLNEQPSDEVRFGATVELRYLNGPMKGKTLKLQIVGVDEANVKKQKIAFVAPLAKALMGAKVDEERELILGSEQRALKVLAILYNDGAQSIN